ncbi:13849_t:CDS:2, partial [Entrophospora sp. SA101]
TNDGMYMVHESVNTDKDQFGIVGVQIVGNEINLNVLVRDKVKIPVQLSDASIVTKFVETLLLLHNILITNLSLLYNGLVCISERLKENSTTIDSE